jgi:phosphoribosylamine--glycine ligase / phosphoribosylformylglycinamidine cyclo-ligase
MNVLIIGSGGREHALAWKLGQSKRLGKLIVAPGNAGTPGNAPVQADDIPGLLALAREQHADLTIVGPEVPLAEGIVDAFQAAGLRIFGPSRAAARLEGSKAFAKEIMRAANVATADFRVARSLPEALRFLITRPFASSPGCVIKADGLAAGKGVFVCDDLAGAEAALKRIFEDREFGASGDAAVIEARMSGPELSVLAFCDGKTVLTMPPARDHKRVGEGDTGPNTGGMGAFAPAPGISPALIDEIKRSVLQPVVDVMRAHGTPYKGVLYAGIMLTAQGPRVLEFNCRFGDPETQVILPLLESDLIDVIDACIDGALTPSAVRWSSRSAASVVLAAPGYPGAYPKGLPIAGLDQLPSGVMAFHAGTALHKGRVVTSGGRVLNITATGPDLRAALRAAYAGVAQVSFDGMHFRRDIGASALVDAAPAERVQDSSYASSGVNIDEGNRAIELMKAAVKSTHDARVLAGIGAFGGMFDASALKNMASPVLVASTDGVGTKTMVAKRAGRWDTVGADLVNHCVNDILVQGATPLFFMDYVAAAKLNAEQIAAVVGGVARACRENGLALLGGETAEMPDVYREGEIDVAGTIVGVVDRGAAITGERVKAGDVIVGLPSTGLHTNGYSLARRALASLDPAQPVAALGCSIDEALLAVHRSYLPHVRAIQTAGVDIHGMAHITGGGFIENVPRVLPDALAAVIRQGSWQVPPIFELIQELGQVSNDEMMRVFNMGVGMIVIVPSAQRAAALAAAGAGAAVIGEVAARGDGPAVVL